MSDPSANQESSPTPVPASADTGPAAPGPVSTEVTAATETAKADLLKRFLALLIDGVIAAVLSRIPWLGGIVAGLYLLLRDGFDFEFMDHRSLGKRIMRLRPLCDDGSPVTLQVSAKRNWTIAVSSLAVVLLIFPLLGLVLVPLTWVIGLVLVLVEAYLTVTDAEGRRWGDRLAGTRVVETES